MAKITSTNVSSGYNVTVNENFSRIDDELNNKVLYRNNPTGEPNQMLNDLDMNSNDILNAGQADFTGVTINSFDLTGVAAALEANTNITSTSIVTTATGTQSLAVALDRRVVTFDTIAELVAAPGLSIGMVVGITDYATGNNSGLLIGSIVAAGTGTADGGSYIDVTGFQWRQNFQRSVSIKQFGAKGDGSIATAQIQAALNFSLDVYSPQGNYGLNATLIMRTAGQLNGAGAEKTIWQRNTNYGDTLQVGDVPGRTFGANDFAIRGIWFYRPFTYIAGTTTIIDNPVAAGAAAVNVYGGQRGLIEGCFFSAMPYNVVLEQTSLTTIKRNTFNGIWDPDVVGLQEGLASVYLKSDTTTVNTLNTIDNNHLTGGFFTEPRNVTIGTTTFSTTRQIGAKVGVLINSAEGLNITNNYLGGQAEWSVKCHTNQITAGIKVSDNFFDAGLKGGVQFETQTSSYRVVGAQIHDNYFNGQLINERAVESQFPASFVSVSSLEIHDNVVENFTKTPVVLNGVDGGSVDNNIITAYDSRAGGVGDTDFASGVKILSGSVLVRTGNNKYGGGINGPSGANDCKWGIVWESQSSGYSENEQELFLGAANPILVQNSGTNGKTAVLTAAGNYTFVSPVDTLLIKKTTPAATQVTPPATPFIGQVVKIKDSDGVAATTGSIQIVGTVDGVLNPVYAVAYVTVTIVWNGVEWNRLD